MSYTIIIHALFFILPVLLFMITVLRDIYHVILFTFPVLLFKNRTGNELPFFFLFFFIHLDIVLISFF
ncbi:hypothetical protein BY996DRAFT_7093744, partial [Phakopsora pachyrhizi]